MFRICFFSIIYFISINIFLLGHLLAQEVEKINKEEISDNFVYSNPKISIYLELLGKGFYSINTDYRINKSNAISMGVSMVEEGAIMPNFMYYKFRGNKFRRELGIGMSATLTQTHGCVHILINGVWGYRYQQKNGLLFRFGFTPFIIYGVSADSDLAEIVPSVGISKAV